MRRSPYFIKNMGLPETTAEMITKLGLDGGKTYTQTYATAIETVPAATAGAGTGADGTTPSGAEYLLTNADVLANRKLINSIIDALQAAGIVD